MSILVVNSLKHSTGSSPTLTLPITDGTSGQVLSSTNNSGTLAFAGAQLEAQNGTNITFPASAADNSTMVTDANGTLTASVAGTNPMNTPDNAHQGERLLDRYVLSGGTNVNEIFLSTPTGYTATELNTLRTMRVVITGLGTSGGGWYPMMHLTQGFNGSNTTYFNNGQDFQIGKFYMGNTSSSQSNQNSDSFMQTSNQKFRLTYTGIYRDNSDGEVDYFSQTAKSQTKRYNSNCSLLFGEIMIDCASSPTISCDLKYCDNNNAGGNGYYTEYSFMPNYGTSLTAGGASTTSNNGRHPMGISFESNNGSTFSCGAIELYGTFKDGVVS